MQAIFYTYSKRDNSTAHPSSGGTELSVTWKEETEILSPALEVHYASAFTFNYCYIAFTQRYYKIRGVTSIAKDTYLLQCEADTLANWISSVLGQSVYADLCSYDFNEDLDDSRICPAGNAVITIPNVSITPSVFNSPDEYGNLTYKEFLGAISENGLLNGIDIGYGDVGSMSEVLQRFAHLSFIEDLKSGSPWDAICEAYYLPFNPTMCHDLDYLHDMVIWGIMHECNCIENVQAKRYSTTLNIPAPNHPNDFRFSDKYVKYYLNIPYSGVVTLPTSLVEANYKATLGAPKVGIIYSADCISGQFAAEVRVGGVSLGQYGANFKVNVPLGGRQSQQSAIIRSGVTGAVGAIGGAGAAIAGGAGLTAAIVAGAAGGAFSAAKTALDIPPINSFGQYSGSTALAALGASDNLVGKFAVIKVEAPSNIEPSTLAATLGRPAAKVTTIQSGYIKASNASVSFGGLSEEIAAFNALLNGGIYVE